MDFNNLYNFLEKGFYDFSSNDALVKLEAGEIVSSMSFVELKEELSLIARGLIYLGLKKSNTACILSSSFGNPYSTIIDCSIVSCGAISVSISTDFSLDEIVSIINDSEGRFLFVDNKDIYLSISSRIRVSNVIYMGFSLPDAFGSHSNFFCLSDIMKFGSMVKEDDFNARVSSIGLNDLASIVYTSGTTGSPKGVILTHSNIIVSVQSFLKVFPYSLSGLWTCHIIPFFHIDAKLLQYLCIVSGAVQCYSADIYNDLKVISPHFLFAGVDFTDYIYDVFSFSSASNSLSFGSSSSLGLFSFFGRGLSSYFDSIGLKVFKLVSNSYNSLLTSGRVSSSEKGLGSKVLSLRERLIRSFLLPKLYSFVGDRLSFILFSGGFVLDDFRRLFSFLGIDLLEAYSVTEACSIVHLNIFKSGNSFIYQRSSIVPFGNISIKLSKEGEVLVKSDNLMFAYYKDDDGLKGLLDKDAYFCTGDVGLMDEDGFLDMVVRGSDLIELSGGELIFPEDLEWKIKLSSVYIKDIFVYGSGKDFITALVVLDRDNMFRVIPSRKTRLNFSKYIQDSSVISFIGDELSRINRGLEGYERVKDFAVLGGNFAEDIEGVYTVTHKLRRHLVVERYKKLFDQFYSERYN